MNLARIRFHKRSVIVTWLVSYVSVLLIPIMISGILYAATWHVVESEMNRANTSALQQMEQAIDNSLRGIERISLEIALSKLVTGFIHTAKPLTDNDYYDLVSISSDLRLYQTANDFIEQIYIYYRNSDTVISTRDHTNSRILYEKTREQETMSYEEWAKFFAKPYMQEYTPITFREDGQALKAVMYAKSVILANPDQPGAVILFVIKDSKLLANIPSTSTKTSIAVLDKENRLVASTGFEARSAFLDYGKLTGKNGMFMSDDGDQRVAVSYITSDSNGWKYIYAIPAELFDDKMAYMKKLIYASVILSLLMGGVVTYLFLRKNYIPINVLIRSFSMKSGVSFHEGSNEYGYLQDALNNTFAEKEQVDRRLHQHRDAIRSHFLQGLLKGRLEQNVPIHESLAAHDIRLASPHFAVLLFYVEHYGKFDLGEHAPPEKVRMLHFLIMNVAEEVIGDANQAFITEIDNMLACIVNFGSDPDADELKRIAEQVKTFLLDHFHVHLTVAISEIHQELYGIPPAYQMTLAALEYRLVMGSGEIIRYQDLPSSETAGPSRSYYYPLTVEHQLINLVKAGDFEKSNAIINEIIEINISDASLSVPLAKCLMFDLTSTLLKTMDEIGTSSHHRAFVVNTDQIDRLITSSTIKEMKGQIREVLAEVCQFIQEGREQDYNTLSQQVIDYVKGHYADVNLNISMVGEKFELTPSYLSKQFKAQTGEALLDFISRTRLEEAKRLLSLQQLSVSDIAKQVGYSDINTFNRIFKKFEGITPGKYKDIQ
ncbi:putative HTH-type transcriptional regulator YtdP [Paenibacillus marchantiophytorum]|uniref:HTH-type transcriptional regulator YtdP n=1 Tax=Paenibacillus marchantiophytorum TaxID=1619310 RepID=A0ABQ1EQJ3_9BACL|nr:helix-turn-helix domain-containing protein [Paenibacillus marchantiophytorum]GFZ81845.1 putative HTH-type transcriptional regulator YtdP [Paenibacillus marchantiophytorum]